MDILKLNINNTTSSQDMCADNIDSGKEDCPNIINSNAPISVILDTADDSLPHLILHESNQTNGRRVHINTLKISHTEQGFKLIDGDDHIQLASGDQLILPKHTVNITIEQQPSLLQELHADHRAPNYDAEQSWSDDFLNPIALPGDSGAHLNQHDPLSFLSDQQPSIPPYLPATPTHDNRQREQDAPCSSLNTHFEPPQRIIVDPTKPSTLSTRLHHLKKALAG